MYLYNANLDILLKARKVRTIEKHYYLSIQNWDTLERVCYWKPMGIKTQAHLDNLLIGGYKKIDQRTAKLLTEAIEKETEVE